MSMSDVVYLLKQDLRQSLRFKPARGKRTKRTSPIRRFMPIIIPTAVAAAILYAILAVTPIVGWSVVRDLILNNLGIGAALFNAILVFTFMGSVMVSTTTVGNGPRMEYMMVMPISLRSLFMEKTLIIILYNSVLWIVVGVPIFLGFSVVSGSPFAFLSVVTFVLLMLSLLTTGVSLGGLVGLLFARLLAGRRRLKQAGYFVMTAFAIVISMVWYVSIYSDSGGSAIFDWLINLAVSLGFSSDLTPGYTISAIPLGMLVGVPFRLQDLILAVTIAGVALLLLYANSVVSEAAHYSGWLAAGSVRSSKRVVLPKHTNWDPRPIPGLMFNTTISVSIWYNLANVRREARVFANYLLGPLRIVIWFFIPVLGSGSSDVLSGFLPYFGMSAMIPIAASYGLYFAGYETVYEGKNLMNLQLAATNLEDYVKGKIYSALPFSLAAGVLMSIVVVIISPSMWLYIGILPVIAVSTTMASGAISANAAALGGDFKAERSITRQRGASVQMPIKGWSILRAQLVPNMIGFIAVGVIIALGIVAGPLLSYAALPFYYLGCLGLTRHYARAAGRKLAQIEASQYL